LGLFVYTRHTSDCPKKSDRFWKRCHCPKWVRGILNGSPVRETARTRSWEKAEDKRRQIEEAADEQASSIRVGEPPPRAPELVTVQNAVKKFLASKRTENLADSTLDKLTTIFEKQFLGWSNSAGFTHIMEITTADLEGFRDTWTDGPLAKKKKQERLIGFFTTACASAGSSPIPPFCSAESERKPLPRITFQKMNSTRLWARRTYISRKAGWNVGTRRLGSAF